MTRAGCWSTLAVMLADGGTTISDLAVLRNQPELFGPVASTATAWRVLDQVDGTLLDGLRSARAAARERVWLQAADTGRLPLETTAGGRVWSGIRVQLDATLVTAHSEKESAAATFKGGYGYHPLTAWCDNTGEALATLLRPVNAGSNTAADHITVTDRALAQIPDAHRHGTPILVCADGAGATKPWLAHLRRIREVQGLDLRFSVGFTMTAAVQAAILALPKAAWTAAIEADGELRDGADVAELTGSLGDLTAAGWPAGMRVIVRWERPHPGAQLTFSDADGWRFQTSSPPIPKSASSPTSRPGTAPTPASRTGSAAPRTPRWPTCRPGSSTSTPSGSSSSASPATYSPGPGCCSSTALWPLPSRSSCATGCCTWPAAWSAADDDCSSGSTATGPGKTRSSTPSPGSSPCRSRPTDRELSPLRTRRRSRRSGRPLPPAQDQIKPERLNDLPLGRLPKDRG